MSRYGGPTRYHRPRSTSAEQGQGDRRAGLDGSRRRVVVQCERLRPDRRVGDRDVQRVNGTCRHDRGAEFAVIVTAGGVMTAARAGGPRYGIHLVDRGALERRTVPGSRCTGFSGSRCAGTEREVAPRISAGKKVAKLTLRQ
ncbi:restriction endonuclease [Streptomyces nitrosporeus]|uniref:restriction endonuclease n=1 Tax=Streptomyces nitrosporeus TaxID=28894 RepID=UPI00399F74CC